MKANQVNVMALALAVLAACFFAGASAARATPTAAAGIDAASSSAASRPAVDAAAYRNTQPIIGILTQPCSDCPGK